MRPVQQTKLGYPEGNCFMAAIASVIECELGELPDLFTECCSPEGKEWDGADHAWWDVTKLALKGMGWYVFCMYPATGVPRGYAVAGGWSPRDDVVDADGENAGHCVVVLDGALAFDPHPSGDGLKGDPTEFYVLVRLVKAEGSDVRVTV